MLQKQHLSTIRAALLFWKEEIAVHDARVAQAYFDTGQFEPLSVAEVEILRQRLLHVRYAIFDSAASRLVATKLIAPGPASRLVSVESMVATVILPGQRQRDQRGQSEPV